MPGATITITPVAGDIVAGAASISATSLSTPLLKNTTGATLLKYAAVYEKTDGTIAYAVASAEATSRVTGLLLLTLSDGTSGRATTNGHITSYIKEADSPATVKGDALYLSATESGALTKAPPTGDGQVMVLVGRVSNEGFLVEIASPILL